MSFRRDRHVLAMRPSHARAGMPIRGGLVALCIAGAGALLLAQGPPPGQEPLPTFRSGIEAVQVHAFVTDADGNPVTDLTADDFEIVEDGVARPVTTFALVNIPIEQPLGRADTWSVESDVAGNDGPEGRIYLFLLDEMDPPLALRTRQFVRWFLEEHFGPNDLAAVSLAGRGLATTGQPFTGSPRLLLQSIDRFSGGFEGPRFGCESAERARASESVGTSRSQTLPFEQWGHVRSRMQSLRAAVETMAAMPGGRKVILFFAECIGHDMFEVRDYQGGVLSALGEDAHAAMAAATRGNVVIYPMDPTGLDAGGGLALLESRADMAALAEVTGGFALTNSNSFSQAFERVVRENSTYYVLGFNSAYERRDGRYVGVDVRVRRPGVQVQSREGYVAPLGPARRAESAAAGAGTTAALASPITTRGLPMRVFATPYKGTAREAAVALVVEIGSWDLPLVERDGMLRTTVDVSYVATDSSNRVYPGAAHAMTLSRRPGQKPPPVEQWLRVVSQLSLPEGQYQIRVAASAGALTGSVLYDLTVPDFGRRPLELSGITLTSASAADTATLRSAAGGGGGLAIGCRPPSCTVPLAINSAPAAADPLRGALPAPPTARRTFDRADTVALFVEVYERPRGESDHRITLTAELRGEDGRRVPVAADTRASTAERRASGGYGFTVRLPLRDVPPGRYVLHVEAQSDADGGVVTGGVPVVVR